MWCRICGQDVPGIPSLDGRAYSCARCGDPVTSISPQVTTASQSASPFKESAAKTSTASMAAQQPPIYDGWDIDEELRHIRSVLGRGSVPKKDFDEPAAQPKYRLDAGHDTPAPHGKRARRSTLRTSRRTGRLTSSDRERASGDHSLAALAWTTMLLGTTGFVSGLALMGWSISAERPDLWSFGTPIILAGQIVLIFGLVLQLDRIWRDRRRHAAKLETVDEQLHAPQATTTLLDAGQGPSGAFYSHWVGGAGPEVLLSDLKSQLDLLAEKLAE